jgi:hypothetical protein
MAASLLPTLHQAGTSAAAENPALIVAGLIAHELIGKRTVKQTGAISGYPDH